ncbi:MHYT domain-containing protein [Rhodococcus sp. NPDC060086]|uniref:MHYT domain-containing protein n=1 Tax=Rhodococcus sp. NPDC060086 TaxID=3347055 RepID=UPI0036657975
MSHELHHFTMGLWVLGLAYAVSVVGAYTGLSCAHQAARHPPGSTRRGWLLMASVAIGGVGIWLMHFMGMMGFDVPATLVRYDLELTVFSAVVAVAATLFGLWLVTLRTFAGRRLPRALTLSVGGLLMGLAVSLMHYSGMAAIRIQGTLTHTPMFVVASVIIGIVAATAALWLAGVAERHLTRIAGALIMGCAVVALHYTGMAGTQATVDPTAQAPEGLTVLSLLLPAYALGMIVLAVPIVALLLAPQPTEAHYDTKIAQLTALGAVEAVDSPQQGTPA